MSVGEPRPAAEPDAEGSIPTRVGEPLCGKQPLLLIRVDPASLEY